MTKPHSHRGEPQDEDQLDDREPHMPAHAARHEEADDAEEQVSSA